MRWKSSGALIGAIAFGAGLEPGIAGEIKPAARDACQKTIDRIGASVGHEEVKTPDGRAAIRYLVRTNGFDYVVTCDATNGFVSDVTPHRG